MFFMLILMLWDQSSHKEVDDVCKPGSLTQYGKEMLMGKCVTNVSHTLDVGAQ